MSRYTLVENDLVITIGMDFACQFWVTDHRGVQFPMDLPARMTVKDNLGQVLFETAGSPGTVYEQPPDPLTEAVLVTSPTAGMMQVTIPRGLTSYWTAGTYYYDIWATINDTDSQLVGATGAQQPIFPTGQQLPITKGRFIIRNRTTNMEDY